MEYSRQPVEVTAAKSSATAESTSASAAAARALAGWLLARYGMASPECTASNSTLSIERRDGGRGRTTTISESTNDEVPRNATPSYRNRPRPPVAFLKRSTSGLASVCPASRAVPSRNATIQCGVVAIVLWYVFALRLRLPRPTDSAPRCS